MGIIKKTLSVKPERSAINILAEGNRLSGELNVSGKMHIDGTFEGSIVSGNELTIGRRGSVKGKLTAPNVTVCGRLEGELSCNEVHIESSGEVNGLVVCQNMSIDNGGTFIGERRTIEKVVEAAPVKQLESDMMLDVIDSLPDKIVLSKDD